MSELIKDFQKIFVTLGNLFKRENQMPEFEIISNGKAKIEQTGWDNYGDVEIYGIFIETNLDIYSKHGHSIKKIEESIKKRIEPILRGYPQTWLGEVVITPKLSNMLEVESYKFPNEELVQALERQKNVMISVATDGAKIQDVNEKYKEDCRFIEAALGERGIINPIPFSDLWEWYRRWKDGTLPTYQSRRFFVNEMLSRLIGEIKSNNEIHGEKIFELPTGWTRVDRSLSEIRSRLVQAKNEEQFQAVGLLCRETIISLAETVYNPEVHLSSDGVTPSKTDAKRMLDSYLSNVLAGKTNEAARKHAKAALDLTNDLTHRRTADFRDAALCAESTSSVVNLVAIISGRRDPK